MILCQAFGSSFFKEKSFSVLSFFLIILWSNSDGPGWTQLLCFPFWQSNFIKLFDGGLQYEVIRTFNFQNSKYLWCHFFSNQLSARAALVYCSSVKFNAPVGAIDHRYEEEPVLNGVECDEDFLLAPLKDEPTDYGGAHHHYS